MQDRSSQGPDRQSVASGSSLGQQQAADQLRTIRMKCDRDAFRLEALYPMVHKSLGDACRELKVEGLINIFNSHIMTAQIAAGVLMREAASLSLIENSESRTQRSENLIFAAIDQGLKFWDIHSSSDRANFIDYDTGISFEALRAGAIVRAYSWREAAVALTDDDLYGLIKVAGKAALRWPNASTALIEGMEKLGLRPSDNFDLFHSKIHLIRAARLFRTDLTLSTESDEPNKLQSKFREMLSGAVEEFISRLSAKELYSRFKSAYPLGLSLVLNDLSKGNFRATEVEQALINPQLYKDLGLRALDRLA